VVDTLWFSSRASEVIILLMESLKHQRITRSSEEKTTAKLQLMDSISEKDLHL